MATVTPLRCRFTVHIGTIWGWALNTKPRPLNPRERDPLPTVQKAGSFPGSVLTVAENNASTGIRSPDLPPRSESL